jgi:hypothetical protein
MSRLSRCVRFAVLVAAVPAFGQSVTVVLPAPPRPTVHVVVPSPVVVVPAPVVVEHRTVVVQTKSNRGKHKGHKK